MALRSNKPPILPALRGLQKRPVRARRYLSASGGELLPFVAGRLLQPGDRRLAFLDGAPAVGGLGQTRPRPLEQRPVPQRGREIGVGHPVDRPRLTSSRSLTRCGDPSGPASSARAASSRPVVATRGADRARRPHRGHAPRIGQAQVVPAMERPDHLELIAGGAAHRGGATAAARAAARARRQLVGPIEHPGGAPRAIGADLRQGLRLREAIEIRAAGRARRLPAAPNG